MKFLCVACDEAMKLTETTKPDDGSLTVIFRCPSCGRETAMLTNAMETQMVRGLGVKIGGRTTQAEPMEMVRNSLAQSRDATAPSTDESGESKCPFTGMVEDAFAKNPDKVDKLVWTKEAEERIANVPSFAKPMVRKGVEMHALENGYTEINDSVMDEVKGRFGM